MKLMTKEILKRFEKVGRQDIPDPIVIVKFFTIWTSWTWYATEYYPEEGVFFGYVVGFEEEWGTFSLSGLESIKGPLGLKIERDLHFSECRFSNLGV